MSDSTSPPNHSPAGSTVAPTDWQSFASSPPRAWSDRGGDGGSSNASEYFSFENSPARAAEGGVNDGGSSHGSEYRRFESSRARGSEDQSLPVSSSHGFEYHSFSSTSSHGSKHQRYPSHSSDSDEVHDILTDTHDELMAQFRASEADLGKHHPVRAEDATAAHDAEHQSPSASSADPYRVPQGDSTTSLKDLMAQSRARVQISKARIVEASKILKQIPERKRDGYAYQAWLRLLKLWEWGLAKLKEQIARLEKMIEENERREGLSREHGAGADESSSASLPAAASDSGYQTPRTSPTPNLRSIASLDILCAQVEARLDSTRRKITAHAARQEKLSQRAEVSGNEIEESEAEMVELVKVMERQHLQVEQCHTMLAMKQRHIRGSLGGQSACGV